MINFETRGDFKNTERFLRRMSSLDISAALKALAMQGVRALATATPRDSGLTAASWGFEITRSRMSSSITWTNSDIESGFPVAIMLQYGHGTGSGGYVRGIDYINPAIRPVFDMIADDVWRIVSAD